MIRRLAIHLSACVSTIDLQPNYSQELLCGSFSSAEGICSMKNNATALVVPRWRSARGCGRHDRIRVEQQLPLLLLPIELVRYLVLEQRYMRVGRRRLASSETPKSKLGPTIDRKRIRRYSARTRLSDRPLSLPVPTWGTLRRGTHCMQNHV
ncbi:hypothetical protein BC834DRAFT_270330 [Gloeopeniophorella convolvens]|nr:hypothetical protein BC834DRAFT_270330 [Gloeopeniophorella convolvens]